MNFSFSQSHRDGFIVAQGFNPGLILRIRYFKSHRDDFINLHICRTNIIDKDHHNPAGD